jgi:hypothetical protein
LCGKLTVSLDNTLWFAGIVIQAAVLALLFYKRVWRTLPVFFVFCAWDLFCDGSNYVVLRFFSGSYVSIYLIETIVGSVLEFSVLIELAWSVLRPIRSSLPRRALVVVGLLIVAAGAIIWPFTGIQGFASLSPQIQGIVRIQQTTSVLRILFFLLLAGGSQLLSIGWRHRELQVATGLGFYSFVSLAVAMLHSHQTMGPLYRYLNQVLVASYVLSLLYWVFSFAQKEAERREFTPQMQQFLLAVAGNARATRLAMASSAVDKTRGGGKS